MKKIIAATLGLSAFIAFAFASPVNKTDETLFQEETPLVITLDGIEDGESAKINNEVYLSETE